MFKKLLFTLALGATTFMSYGQYSEDFTNPATYTIGGQGYPSSVAVTVEDFPAGTTGGPTATKALQIVEDPAAKNWHFPIITPASSLALADGNTITLWCMPGVVGSGVFSLGLKNGGNATEQFTDNYTTTSATEWVQLTFDISGFTYATSGRLEYHSDSTNQFAAGRTFYITNVVQSNTLSFKSPQKDLSGAVSPNPVEDILTVNVEGAETYKLVNTVGQTVLEQKATGSINVSGLTSGLYILVTEKGTAKVIVK